MRVLLILLLITSGCSAVHNVEMQNLKAFARSSKTLSYTPGELYHNISDFRQQLRLIESSTLFTADKIIPRLDQTLTMQQAFEQNVSKVKEACELISTYSDGLMSLAGAGKDLEETSEGLSLRISCALKNYNSAFKKQIPVSVGNFLGVVVSQIGSIELKKLQKKYLKEFINSGAVIINEVCDYFTGDMSLSLKDEMTSLDAQFKNVMQNFYDNVEIYQRKQNVNPFDYYKYYNPVYIELKQTLIELNNLREQTIEGMHKIKTTHEKLLSSLNINRPGEYLTEVKDLYLAMVEIKLGYDHLKIIHAK